MFSIIVGAHALIAGAVLSLGGMQVMREAPPLLVQLIESPRPRIIDTPRPVPLPNMRPPEIHIPTPPLENLFTIRVEEIPPAPPAPITVAVVAAAPVAEPQPVAEPPRADMAYLNNPAPSYPAVSKRAGEQGRVLLRVRVDAQGQVEKVEIQATSGFPRLDEAALAAVRRWRFVPARLGDRAIAGWAVVPVAFTLQG